MLDLLLDLYVSCLLGCLGESRLSFKLQFDKNRLRMAGYIFAFAIYSYAGE